jgi:hypothetical protein
LVVVALEVCVILQELRVPLVLVVVVAPVMQELQ